LGTHSTTIAPLRLSFVNTETITPNFYLEKVAEYENLLLMKDTGWKLIWKK